MNVEPKNLRKKEAIASENAKHEKAIARQWLAFSKTEAYADLMQYGHSTSDMLMSYAKERVMPSPVKDGEQIIINGETASSLLQNSRGCDIILSYVEEHVSSALNK